MKMLRWPLVNFSHHVTNNDQIIIKLNKKQSFSTPFHITGTVIETISYTFSRMLNTVADSEQLLTGSIAVLHCFIINSVCCSAECMALWVCINYFIEHLFVTVELISAGSLVSGFPSISSSSVVHLYLSLCFGMIVFSELYELLS